MIVIVGLCYALEGVCVSSAVKCSGACVVPQVASRSPTFTSPTSASSWRCAPPATTPTACRSTAPSGSGTAAEYATASSPMSTDQWSGGGPGGPAVWRSRPLWLLTSGPAVVPWSSGGPTVHYVCTHHCH